MDDPGTFHHVMSHCVEGCQALSEETIRKDFLKRLSTLVEKGALRIHAWALMLNHYHLLAEPTGLPLSVSMQRLLTGFASQYNRRKSRRGHVFDARFRSILVEKESYFLKLVAYIHLNPIKAGLVGSLKQLAEYPWTGHAAIMGERTCGWLTTDVLESLLGSTDEDLKVQCEELLLAELGEEEGVLETGSFTIASGGLKTVDAQAPVSPHSRTIRVLGSKTFALEQYKRTRNMRRARLRNRLEQHAAMEAVLSMVAQEHVLPEAMLRSGGKGKRLTEARRQLIRQLVWETGVSQADIASYLRLSQSAVSQILDSLSDQKTRP